MSSSTDRDIIKSIKVKDIEMDQISNLSPVTDLALNMKSLTTSLSGTPSRRISWSNPYVCDASSKFLEELSPSTDSPTFQEISCRMKSKLKKPSRKVLPSDWEDEKENVAPGPAINYDKLKYPSEISTSECDSQDSGYSDLSVKRFETKTLGSTPRIRVKSSIFLDDDDEDGFDNMCQMDVDEDDKELIPMPDIANLLTKPLCNSRKPSNPSNSFTKQGKLPIRRCLTMEMECSPEVYHKSRIISKTGTFVSSSAIHNPVTTILESYEKCTFKRPDPPSSCFSIQSKRRKSSPSVHLSEEFKKNDFTFQRSFSETATTIMHAVQKADLIPDLIGDCSRCYTLPLVRGRHQDLKCISSETLVHVMKGEFSFEIDKYTLVDCRYPYEFEGGHIQGALNIYTKEEILETFLKHTSAPSSAKSVIIFHCEFSSERAPSLCRFLRNKDREINESYYPKLHHPEIYILEGGYKAFFEKFKELCEPQDYKPMNHKDHGFELKHFRAKSKSWGADSKSRYKLKSSSITEVL